MNEENIKREKRRRRRVRNQIFAYITLVILVIAVFAGACFGVFGVVRYVKNYNNKVSEVIAEAELNASAAAESETFIEPAAAGALQGDDTSTIEPVSDPLGELVDTLLQDMTLEEMAAGMFIVTPEALTGVQNVTKAGDGTKNAIVTMPVGGIIYSAANFKSGEQFKEMLGNTKGFAKYPLFMAVGAECGTNLSFGLADTKKASEFAGTDDAKEAYKSIADTLASYGINMGIVSTDKASADVTAAAAQALQESGVSAALQRFPGDDMEEKTLEELKNGGLLLYEAAIKNGVDCVLMSNAKLKEVTGDDTPASLSNVTITEILRGDLGFGGVVITGALDDALITQSYTPAEAAVAAIEAGADIIYRSADFKEAYNGVLKAVEEGKITKERIYESMRRIYMVKYKNTPL